MAAFNLTCGQDVSVYDGNYQGEAACPDFGLPNACSPILVLQNSASILLDFSGDTTWVGERDASLVAKISASINVIRYPP